MLCLSLFAFASKFSVGQLTPRNYSLRDYMQAPGRMGTFVSSKSDYNVPSWFRLLNLGHIFEPQSKTTKNKPKFPKLLGPNFY